MSCIKNLNYLQKMFNRQTKMYLVYARIIYTNISAYLFRM